MSVWEQGGDGDAGPGRRVGHTLDLVQGFGGTTGVVLWGKGGSCYHSDARALRLRDGAWAKPALHGIAVTSRWRHASHALMDRQAVLVTGGLDVSGNPMMDPQLLDISGGPSGPVRSPPCLPRRGLRSVLPGRGRCRLVRLTRGNGPLSSGTGAAL
jgi:hypothetical protein